MTTPRIRSLVSLAAAMAISVITSACATAPATLGRNEQLMAELPSAFRFNNDARDYVRVYLVGDRREWFLGRVEAGAHATLRIPPDALDEQAGSVRIAVVAGGRMALQATGQTRTAIAVAQPVAEIVSQRWSYSQIAAQGQLTTLHLAP